MTFNLLIIHLFLYIIFLFFFDRCTYRNLPEYVCCGGHGHLQVSSRPKWLYNVLYRSDHNGESIFH